ncbi:large adhesive protein [Malaciobacter halophilus]|nr:VWA domain-containing protein [Malaciobacter halophilus]AXH10801.1 large adhesive protein [Malaciobacter halophilus]
MLKLIVKEANGEVKSLDVTDNLVITPKAGQQYYFNNLDGHQYTMNLQDSEKSIVLNMDLGTQKVKIIFKNMVDLVLEENIQDKSVLGIIKDEEGLDELNQTVLNDNFNGDDVIKSLKDLLAQSSTNPEETNGVIIDDFGSLTSMLEAAAAGGSEGDTSTFRPINFNETDDVNILGGRSRLDTQLDGLDSNIPDRDGNNTNEAGDTTDTSADIEVSSVTSDTKTEGTDLVHTVKLSGEADSDKEYDFTFNTGTVEAEDIEAFEFSNGVTYDASTGKITVPAGVTEFTITTPTVDDALKEDTESYEISVGGVDATGTILDNESDIEVSSVTSDTKTEGTDLVHTVKLSGEADSDKEYDFTFNTGTVEAEDIEAFEFSNGVTYDASTGKITVPAGVTEFTITTPTVDDALKEDTESYEISVGGVDATGTILDNESDIEVSSVTSDTKTEGTDLVHTVKLSGEADSDKEYDFTFNTGTVEAEDIEAFEFSNGVTYDASTGKITVPAGVTEFTITTPTVDDALKEDTESYEISVGGVDATGTILDNESDIEVSSVTSDTKTEGTDLVHTVKLSGEADSDKEYDFTFNTGTVEAEDIEAFEFSNGVTYDASTGKITVPAGVTEFTITTPTVDDALKEDTESYEISVGGVDATGTILDNESDIEVSSVTSDTKTEGTDLVHTVKLSGEADSDKEYDFTFNTGTVEAEDIEAFEFSNGVTYDASTGKITVPAGVTEFTITTPTVDDALKEDTESYEISVGGVDATGTILDNESDIEVSSVTSDTKTEGTDLVHTVKLSGEADSDKEYDFTFNTGTVEAEDIEAFEFSNGVTYDASTGKITVPAGVTEFTITTPTVDDALKEDTESYEISVGGVDATGTILDNESDIEVSSVTSDTKTEGTDLVHTVKLSGEADSDKEYDFTFNTGTVEAEDIEAFEFSNGVTYDASTGKITVPAGVTEFTITTPTVDDALKEDTESYEISVGGVDATGTILDNESDIEVSSVTSDTKTEGTDLVHTVKLSGEADSDKEYDFTFNTGTVEAEDIEAFEFSNGVTYDASTGKITVPAGVTEFTITTPTVDDALKEDTESYEISVGGVDATGTILDNESDIEVSSVTSDTKTEGTDLVHTVKLSGEADSDKEYDFTFNTGTVEAEDIEAFEFSNGVTYDASTGKITVPAGVTEFTITTPTVDDALKEDTESYEISVGGVDATGTILDNESDIEVSSVTSDTKTEGTDLVHTVKLSGEADSDKEYDFTFNTGTVEAEDIEAFEFSNGVTYDASTGKITVPAGVTEFTITTPTVDDALKEDTESYEISVGGVDATGTILDNESDIEVSSVTSDTKTEGTDLVHTVKLSGEADSDKEYDFTFNTGTVEAEDIEAFEFSNGVTYDASTGKITVPAGVTEFTITTPTVDDALKEDTESYEISVGGVDATGTILDNESDIEVSSVTSDTKTEGTDLVHTVKLSGEADSDKEYDFTFNTGTVEAEDIEAFEFSNGVTYDASTGKITVPAGVTEFTITTPTVDDALKEDTESYEISVGGVDATGTILDNESDIEVSSVTSDTKTEGTDLVHTVKLSGEADSDKEYDFTFNTGTVEAEDIEAFEFSNGVTYDASTGKITVPAGVTEFTITTPTVDDALKEDTESYEISVGGVDATGTILDNESDIEVSSVTSDTKTEGTDLVHTVKLSGEADSDKEYDFTFNTGTVEAEDIEAFEFSNGVTYDASTGKITVPAGVTEFTITTPTVDDALKEDTESYEISVGGVDATGTILDNESDIEVSSVTSDTKTEGTDLVHTVKLSGEADSDKEYDFTFNTGTVEAEDIEAFEFSNGVTYDASTGKITVPAGVTEFTITTPTVDDALKEDTESYEISVGGVDATGTILDNESDIEVSSVTSDTKTEGTDLVHTVKLSGEADSDKEYDFTFNTGTVEAEDIEAFEFSNGVTYDASTGKITVPAGVTEFTITTPTVDDALKEDTESYEISVGGVDATGTILDNESDIEVSSVTSDTKTEGTDLVHTVKLSGEADSDKEYDFTFNTGTVEAEDIEAFEFSNGVTYDASTGKITVPAGVTEFTITTPTVDDALKEDTESYEISVGGVDATGTILDNESDIEVSSVTSDTKTEGTDLVHTVKLSGEADSDKEYDFTFNTGTVEAEDIEAFEFSNGVTYDASTGKITVPAGVTEFTITTPTVDDALKEDTESYEISVGGVDATGTILDNESDIEVSSVTSDTKTEGTDLVHTVKLSGEADSDKEYDFTFNTGTVEAEDIEAFEFSNGVTYDASTGKITVPAGVTEFTITTPTVDDALKEDTESYEISVGGVDATGTILDNESDIEVSSVTSDTKTEGTDLVHTVKLSGEADSDKEYDFTFNTGTVEAEDIEAFEFSNGVTYDASTGKITVPAGVTEFTITTPTVDDALKEDTESYEISVGGVDATGTILDNESDIEVSSVTSDTKTEGTDLVHTVKLSGEADSDKEYDFTFNTGTVEAEDIEAFEFSNGVTYDASTGKITVPAGVTEFTITTPTVDDALKEDTESYEISVGGVDATGTILDNESDIEVSSVTSDTKTEGTDLVHTVKLSGEADSDKEYDFTFNTGTVEAEDIEAFEFSNGVTYDASTGKITVPAGVTEFTITTPTVDDALKEDTESYEISVGGVDATGTILDNESDIEVSSVTSDTKTEGTDLVHTVKLSGEADSDKEYDFTFNTGTVEAEDIEAFEFSNGVTYDASTGKITVPAGVTEFTITTPTVDDALKEDTESYEISVGGVDATGTILDNESDIEVSSVTSDTKTEGTDLVHTVKLSGEADSDKEYDFTFNTGTVEAEDIEAFEFSNGVTYDASTGKITVPAGVTEFTITTPTVDDALKEDTESYEISVGGVDATGTILDNESDIEVSSVTSDTKTEGTDLVHTVKLSGEADSDKEYDFTFNTGTVEAEDIEAFEFSNGVTYDASTGKITVPAGVTEFTITTPTVDDALKEDTESYEISVGGVDATGTILDNESDIEVSSVTSDTKTEGTDLVHTVKLSGEADSDKEYDFTFNTGTVEAEDIEAFEFSNGVTYDASTGKITVPAGVTEFTITTPTVDDALKEDTESYEISVGGVDATGTILDNESDIEVSSVTSDTKTEGTDLVHTVKLSGEADSDKEYDFTFNTGTVEAEDIEAFEFSNGVTYDASTGKITVPAGVTEFTITTPTVDDALKEDTESYEISVGGVDATGTILDNEVLITLDSPNDVDENATKATYTLNVNIAPQSDLKVIVNINGETKEVIIKEGETSATFDVEVREDDKYKNEDDEYNAEIVSHEGGNYQGEVSYNNEDNTFKVTDDIDAIDVTVTAVATAPKVIDVDTEFGEATGINVTAYDVYGNEGTLSVVKGTNHDGFGVQGNTSGSGASSELGHGNNGVSEKIVFDFTNDADSLDVAFAWRHNGETARVTFFNDTEELGYAEVTGGGSSTDATVNYYDVNGNLLKSVQAQGGTDRVDLSYTFEFPDANGEPTAFDKVEFSAPGHDDDYLINEISYTEVIDPEITNINTSEGKVTFNIQVDENYPPQGQAKAIVEVNGQEYEVDLNATGRGVLTVDAKDFDDLSDINIVVKEIVGGNYEKVNGTDSSFDLSDSFKDDLSSTNDNIVVTEDTTYVLTETDFGELGKDVREFKITQIPENGTLYYKVTSGQTVIDKEGNTYVVTEDTTIEIAENQVISLADIASGKVTFEPDSNSDEDGSFKFEVSDGTTWHDEEYTTSVEVKAVADAPTASISVSNATIIVDNSDFDYDSYVQELKDNSDTYIEGTESHGDYLSADRFNNTDDFIDGKDLSDNMIGYDGDDVFLGQEGDDSIYGGHEGALPSVSDGTDTVIYRGNFDDYKITFISDGSNVRINVIDTRYDASKGWSHPDNQGLDTYEMGDNLYSIEKLVFKDGVYDVIDGELVKEGTKTFEYDVDISAALTDTDGSETLSVKIDGVPEGATLESIDDTYTITKNSDGSYSVEVPSDATSISDNLKLKVPEDSAGDFNLTITARASESNDNEDGTNYKETTNSDAVPFAQDESQVLDFGDTYSKTDENIVIVLDISGSMDDYVQQEDGSWITRLQLAKDALQNMIDTYKEFSNVKINLTSFARTADDLDDSTYVDGEWVSPIDGWYSPEDALKVINKFDAGGGTNYEDALEETYSNYTPPTNGEKATVYFISDGKPSVENNDGWYDEYGIIDSKYLENWKDFLENNAKELNVIGIGKGITDTTYLDKVAQDVGNVKTNVTIIEDENDLKDRLVENVYKKIEGNILDNISGGDGEISVESIVVDGNIYTIDDASNNIVTILTSSGATLDFNFQTGDYSFGGKFNDIKEFTESFVVNTQDEDGDKASVKVNINIENNIDDTVTTPRLDFSVEDNGSQVISHDYDYVKHDSDYYGERYTNEAEYIKYNDDVKGIVQTFGGDDVVYVGDDIKDNGTIYLGNGDDFITVEDKVSGYVFGGEGNDSIYLKDYTYSDYYYNKDYIQSHIKDFENIKFKDGHIIGDSNAFNSSPMSTTVYNYTIVLAAVLADKDGSETLSNITIENLPSSITSIKDSSGNEYTVSNGTVSLPSNEGLQQEYTVVSSTELSNTEINSMKASVTSTESLNGEQKTTETTAKLEVEESSNMIGTDADERFDSHGSNANINAGAGDDEIIYHEGDIVDAGEGEDTLKVLNDEDIDLSNISTKVDNIEAIDLTNDLANHIIVDEQSIEDLTDDENILKIFGDESGEDSVRLEGNWTKSDTTEEIDGERFSVYEGTSGNSNIKILIDEDVSVDPDI